MAADRAIALARALFDEPGLRHDLRRRPVPDDADQVLALVGNDRQHLQQTAAALAMDADELKQAARFYVHEILLFPGADDYRLLGVSPGADAATLKRHYRLLQSWLHPDRAETEVGRVAHAARINAAYRSLRHLPAVEMDRSGEGANPDSPLRTRHWVRVEDQPTRHRGRTLAIATLTLAVLGGGLWLAWQWPQATRPTAPGWVEQASPATPEPAAPAAGRSDVVPTVSRQPPPPPQNPAPADADGHADLSVAQTVAKPLPALPEPASAATQVSLAFDTGAADVPPLTAIAPGTSAPPPAAMDTPSPPAPAIDPPSAAELAAAAQRERAVQQRAHALLTFLARPQAVPPPIWRSGHALDAAEAIRRDLAAGAGGRERARILFDQVRWDIQSDQVQLQAPIAPADRSAPRLLQASFRWHGQDWWVESVALDAGEGAAGQ